MSKKVKKVFALILVLMLIMSMVLCGCQSTEEKIIGRWKCIEGGQFSYLEFFSDGTYDSSHVNYSGNYSIDGNRIKLTGILVANEVYTFEIKGDILNFLYDDGDILASYEKVN